MSNPDPRNGLIATTIQGYVINGESRPGIPTLVWPEGIDEEVSDWLRSLVVERGLACSTAHEYANIIRPFIRLCRARKGGWRSVDDAFLIRWRDRRVKDVNAKRVNTSLEAIFAFYLWAEERKIIRYHVGIYSHFELPEELRNAPFPISATKVFSKTTHGRVFGHWTTPLTLSRARAGVQPRHTPTEDEIRNLHESAIGHRHGERDSLMMSWAEETGTRRSEILRIRVSQMPTLERLGELVERDEPWIITLVRKGGRAMSINVPLDLIVRTLDYVQFARGNLVERFAKMSSDYKEPDELFLSGRTGLRLHADSLTSIGRRIFKSADVERASLHRLRARFAIRVIETLLDALFLGHSIGSESTWIETILVKASEYMGQMSPEALRPYLTYVLNRRIQTADATTAASLAIRIRQLELYQGTLVRRLTSQGDIQRAASQVQSGQDSEAAATLRSLADKLSAAPDAQRA
jgi:integrase